MPDSLDAGTGFCPKPDCRKVMDDHQFFKNGQPIPDKEIPACPERKAVKRASPHA